MRPAIVLGLGLFLATACSRTPPEPEPAPPVSVLSVPPMPTVRPNAVAPVPSPAPPPAVPSDRCIAKWPDTPPRIPPNATGAACPPDPGATPMPTDDVSFLDVETDGHKLKITAELAKTPHDVEKGLMYRRSMADDQGMFFKLDRRTDHSFWMHNTCIALDMMFVDTDGLIVGIVEGAAPLTDSIRHCGCDSAYVLEVNGGWSRKHGVRPGRRITIPFSAR